MGYTARAVIGVPTDDQTVDVRARPTTFAGTGGGDRWFGVMARYVDDSNYYYLTLRHTNLVSLRKLTNGAITELGTYSLPITLGIWYRLRIEAVGAQIRGYVNGVLVAEATDTTHPRGAAGPSPIAPPWISTTITPSSLEPAKKGTFLISL